MLVICLHGLLLESLVDGILNCELLDIILSVLIVSIHLLESLTGDAHIGGLRLVRHFQDLFLLIESFFHARLYHFLVAEGTFETVIGWVLLNLAPIVDLLVVLLSQINHQLLQFCVNPLPKTIVMENVIALSGDNLLISLEIVTANRTTIHFLLILIGFVTHLLQSLLNFCLDQAIGTALSAELEDLLAHALCISFVRALIALPDHDANEKDNDEGSTSIYYPLRKAAIPLSLLDLVI